MKRLEKKIKEYQKWLEQKGYDDTIEDIIEKIINDIDDEMEE